MLRRGLMEGAKGGGERTGLAGRELLVGGRGGGGSASPMSAHARTGG